MCGGGVCVGGVCGVCVCVFITIIIIIITIITIIIAIIICANFYKITIWYFKHNLWSKQVRTLFLVTWQ